MERLLPAEFLAVLIDTNGFDDSTIRRNARDKHHSVLTFDNFVDSLTDLRWHGLADGAS